MRFILPHHMAAQACLLSLGAFLLQAAPPPTPQGLISAKAFLDITGTAVANLTGNTKFPARPDVVMYPAYFEWNATGDITTPAGNWSDNYGGQMVGYFYPPSTGTYVFYLAADDNAALYLSTNASAANKRLIAQETVWSNARQYLESGGNSVLASKDSSQFATSEWPTKDPDTGGGIITLQANQPYYIEALFKEGGGGDFLSVAVLDPGGAIDSSMPIPGEFLSSDRANGPLTITDQPQNLSVDERGAAIFRVTADGTPPHTFQWRRNGADIPDATDARYAVASAAVADHGASFTVVVTGAQGTATSSAAVLSVVPDTVLPTLVSAKGRASLTEVVLVFSEALDPGSATATANYQVSGAGGSLAVTAANVSPDGTAVTLTTASQTLGTKYTVTVSNVRDMAATPNTISPGSRAVFFPMGQLVESADGFIVVEAENFDRNLDNLWVLDTTRGTPSGGASVVNPNGAGGSEGATKLEYDVEFKQAATYFVWIRASGDNGNDDSVWFHFNGERPAERVDGNQASMTGFQPQADFVWRSDSQAGPDPFTVDVPSPGIHSIGLARREDGSFIDKILLTTVTGYTPTGLGPPETREGVPAAPTVALTAPTAGQKFAPGAPIVLTATAAGDKGLEIVRVAFTANGNLLGEATAAPFSFTWSNPTDGIYSIRATATDEIGGASTSGSAVIEVGTPPPQALLVVGTDSDPVLNASDAGIKARLETQGWQVTVVQAPASTTANGEGKQLVIVSSTINSGDVGDKFRDLAVPVLNWEQAVQDNFRMTLDTAADHATLAGQTQVNVVRADHPLAGGVGTGLKTMTTAAQDYSWGVPGPTAVVIATVADNPAQAVIYGYDRGAVLIDGTTPAPARRVMFFSGNNSFAAFTEDAMKLFDAAVAWASGIEPAPPKTSARIAWISFHPADGTPSTAAAGVGFTRAVDVAYTDQLRADGHDVTRIRTSGTPDAALLNAFDLVIISRSVPSGDYQDPPETAAWNGITAPTLILGGYVLRNSRLGFTTGGTMVDMIGPVRLTVNNPTHPVFAGVALDTAGTMVNPYADRVSHNGTVQQGISVNTDPLAGNGTVLATSGTAEDPTVGGTVIAEWVAGATLANPAGDTLGGRRLVLLTGSREMGITSEAAGIYDLSDDGARLFRNAVHYLAGTVPGTARPALSFARTATGLSITFAGTLQSADAITGAWVDVPGATSPFAAVSDQPGRFYRARQ